MTKQKAKKQQSQELTPLERVGLRVSSMINSPKAQLERQVTIHRLDTDLDEAWDGVIELITESEGIDLVFNDDGSVTVTWARELDGDYQVECDEELLMVEEEVIKSTEDGKPGVSPGADYAASLPLKGSCNSSTS